MDPVIAALLGGVGGLVACGVAWAIFFRRTVKGASTDLDELAVEVDRIGRAVRRISMRNLRQDALDAQASSPLPQPAQPASLQDVKAQLRRKVFGGGNRELTQVDR